MNEWVKPSPGGASRRSPRTHPLTLTAAAPRATCGERARYQDGSSLPAHGRGWPELVGPPSVGGVSRRGRGHFQRAALLAHALRRPGDGGAGGALEEAEGRGRGLGP